MQRFAVHTNFLQFQDSLAPDCYYEVMKTCWMCIDVIFLADILKIAKALERPIPGDFLCVSDV
jgi:hypothetical protein